MEEAHPSAAVRTAEHVLRAIAEGRAAPLAPYRDEFEKLVATATPGDPDASATALDEFLSHHGGIAWEVFRVVAEDMVGLVAREFDEACRTGLPPSPEERAALAARLLAPLDHISKILRGEQSELP